MSSSKQKKMLRGMIYGASYSGCEGWSHWNIREIRFRCPVDKVDEFKRRAEERVAKTSTTYTRRGIDWRD